MKAIVVDSSAWLAIVNREANAEQIAQALTNAQNILVSTVSMVEMGAVTISRVDGLHEQLKQLLMHYEVEYVAFDQHMSEVAIEAFRRYGKGRHKAGLNFGDCCSYALAKARRLPLLYKGEDFVHTDIRSALP